MLSLKRDATRPSSWKCSEGHFHFSNIRFFYPPICNRVCPCKYHFFPLGNRDIYIFSYDSGYYAPQVRYEETTTDKTTFDKTSHAPPKEWELSKSIERTIITAKSRASFGNMLSMEESLIQMIEAIDELRSLIVTKNSKVVENKKETGEDREKA